MSSLLLVFPFDLVWGVLLTFLFLLFKENIWFSIPVALISLGIGARLPAEQALQFWAPGGVSTVIVSVTIAYIYLRHPGLTLESEGFKWYSRKQMKEAITSAPEIETKQTLYTRYVMQTANLFCRFEDKIAPRNTLLLLLAFTVVFLVNYLPLEFHFFHTELFRSTIKSLYEQLQMDPGLFKSEEFLVTIRTYAPFFVFLQGTFYFIISHSLVRLILIYREQAVSAYGSILFWKIPDVAVWGYIVLGILAVLAAHFSPSLPDPTATEPVVVQSVTIPAIYSIITQNLLLLMSLVFALQSISTLLAFFQIRFLPGGSILALIFLLSLVFRLFAVVTLITFLIGGLMEFWFSFRKKALHPNFPSNDET